MLKTAPISLENRIIAALTDSNTSLWFPHLTYDLVLTGWQRLKEETGITESNYGTARVILGDPNESRDIAFSLITPNQSKEIKNLIPIEILPKNITDQYKESGVDFYKIEELLYKGITDNEFLNRVRDAFNMIGRIPSLFSTVIMLVKSVHLIKSESDDYDVSFSQPNIPFSIFVSVPQKNSEISALRVAEAIIHEAMHLQLTLIENITPLALYNTGKFFSPWKFEYRTVGGILHALYVFRIINIFFQNLADAKSLKLKNHIDERCGAIYKQICSIREFENCSALTTLGKLLTHRLFTDTF